MDTEIETRAANMAGNLVINFHMTKWFSDLLHAKNCPHVDVEDPFYFDDHRNYFKVATIELINNQRGIPSIGADEDECYMPEHHDFHWWVADFSKNMRKHVNFMNFNESGNFEYHGRINFGLGWQVYHDFLETTGIGTTLHFKKND